VMAWWHTQSSFPSMKRANRMDATASKDEGLALSLHSTFYTLDPSLQEIFGKSTCLPGYSIVLVRSGPLCWPYKENGLDLGSQDVPLCLKDLSSCVRRVGTIKEVDRSGCHDFLYFGGKKHTGYAD
jgi:hypothetical protein